jgi:hypothetical protein
MRSKRSRSFTTRSRRKKRPAAKAQTTHPAQAKSSEVLIVDALEVPEYVEQLADIAEGGCADRYSQHGEHHIAGFTVSPDEACYFPDLEGVSDVWLVYKEEGK